MKIFCRWVGTRNTFQPSGARSGRRNRTHSGCKALFGGRSFAHYRRCAVPCSVTEWSGVF